jgi:hypothetical protein
MQNEEDAVSRPQSSRPKTGMCNLVHTCFPADCQLDGASDVQAAAVFENSFAAVLGGTLRQPGESPPVANREFKAPLDRVRYCFD